GSRYSVGFFPGSTHERTLKRTDDEVASNDALGLFLHLRQSWEKGAGIARVSNGNHEPVLLKMWTGSKIPYRCPASGEFCNWVRP
ncbi:MAG: hypothetical protein AAGF15_02145, partial [Pseudomonadota bacterium]